MQQDAMSQKAREWSSLIALERDFTKSLIFGEPREGILRSFLDGLFELDYARRMILTFKPWRRPSPSLIAERAGDGTRIWPGIQGRSEFEEAHAGRVGRWALPSHDCLSLCFSTNGKGAVALTAVDPRRPEAMLELRPALAPAVENLLIRDRILAPGRPVRDMADCTQTTLDDAEEALRRIQRAGDSRPERLMAQSRLLMRIRGLCQYAHIDSGLEEVASCLFAVTHRFQTEPMTQAHVDALRDVFGSMRAIALSVEDVDACVARLKQGGLSIYDVFGRDEVDTDDG